MIVGLTGADGYAGRCVRARLETLGYELRVATGELSKSRGPIECDVLVHLAGATRLSERDVWQSNVEALAYTLRRLPRHTAVVHISSRAVYAPNPGAYVDEDAPVGPVDVYGESKVAAETLVRYSGRPAVILRASALVGVGVDGCTNVASAVDAMVRTALFGEPIVCRGDDLWIDPLHIWELADAITRLIICRRAWGRTLNVAGPAVRLRDLARTVAAETEWQTGRSCRVVTGDKDTAPTLLDCGRLRRLLGWIPEDKPDSVVPRVVAAIKQREKALE